jgi:hypothetical protein
METRRLLIALMGINAAVLAVLIIRPAGLFAAGDPETVRARAIELVDQHGRVRAQLNVESNGEAVLRLRDAKGEVRVKLGADGEGSGLILLDGATEPRIQLLAKNSGTSVTLTSQGGQRRVLTPRE